MAPTLIAGDLVIAKPDSTPAEVGSLVIVKHLDAPNGLLIKRLSSKTDSTFAVSSDNPVEALDSRSLGSFPMQDYVATVMLIRRKQGGFRLVS